MKAACGPYEDALRTISREVKAFGGCGTVHGCIVDIDYYNHIYLNPFDGKATAYYAEDICSRDTFKSVPALLQARVPDLLAAFERADGTGSLPVLGGLQDKPNTAR